jgi:hypothetical protein
VALAIIVSGRHAWSPSGGGRHMVERRIENIHSKDEVNRAKQVKIKLVRWGRFVD